MAGPPLDENGDKIPPWRLPQNWYVPLLSFLPSSSSLTLSLLAGTRPSRREVTLTAVDLLLLNLSTRPTLDRALATRTSVLLLLAVCSLPPRWFRSVADVPSFRRRRASCCPDDAAAVPRRWLPAAAVPSGVDGRPFLTLPSSPCPNSLLTHTHPTYYPSQICILTNATNASRLDLRFALA